MLDYRLGYIRSGCDQPGFDTLGDGERRIVALGGYTTPEMARSGHTWADLLLRRQGMGAQILNGCTDGYASAQILTMFIRDVVMFQPETVVCLSGFHNIAYKVGFVENRADAGLLRTHPFVTPRQLRFLRAITVRFGLGNGEVYYGEENHLPAWELWLRQMAEMKALCDAFNIVCKVFLQPSVFSGAYQYSEREKTFLCEHYGFTGEQIEEFRELFQAEYGEIAVHARGLEYITDLTGVFNGCRDVYLDAYHMKDAYLPKLMGDIV